MKMFIDMVHVHRYGMNKLRHCHLCILDHSMDWLWMSFRQWIK